MQTFYNSYFILVVTMEISTKITSASYLSLAMTWKVDATGVRRLIHSPELFARPKNCVLIRS